MMSRELTVERDGTSSSSWLSSVVWFPIRLFELFSPWNWLWASKHQDPSAACAKFIQEFQLSYVNGAVPEFFQGSYQQVCSKAKSEFKFLVVYLHSSGHTNTPTFCRETLCASSVTDFMRENVIFWGASVNMSEGFQLSHVLGASTFPFMAVLCNNSIGGLTVVDRIEGPVLPEELITRFSLSLENHSAPLAAARIEQEERNRDRLLREEQDQEFQRALHQDQEKERLHRENEQRAQAAADAMRRQDVDRLMLEQERKLAKSRLLAQLPQQPSADDKNVSQLVIRLPDGSRLTRRFSTHNNLQNVVDFVNSDARVPWVEPGSFDLVTHFPRRVFSDPQITLAEAGLFPHASLFVEERS